MPSDLTPERIEREQEFGKDHPWDGFEAWHETDHKVYGIAWPCIQPLRCLWRYTRKSGAVLTQNGMGHDELGRLRLALTKEVAERDAAEAAALERATELAQKMWASNSATLPSEYATAIRSLAANPNALEEHDQQIHGIYNVLLRAAESAINNPGHLARKRLEEAFHVVMRERAQIAALEAAAQPVEDKLGQIGESGTGTAAAQQKEEHGVDLSAPEGETPR